jgi:hypothetical protein
VNYATAETAQDIARLLRSNHPELIITAPRRSGKTTELLRYAESKNPNGQFVVVCHNFERQNLIIRRHWELFNRISQADIVAKRLLGEPLGGIDVTPPLMISPGTFHVLRGNNLPIYVDELGEISNEDVMKRVIETGRFVAAVTS